MKRTVINLINSPKTEMTLGGSWEMDLCTGCCVKHPICQTGKIAKIKKVKKIWKNNANVAMDTSSQVAKMSKLQITNLSCGPQWFRTASSFAEMYILN